MMSCVVYAYKYWPAVNLTPDDLRYLVSLNAEFDVDLYDQIDV